MTTQIFLWMKSRTTQVHGMKREMASVQFRNYFFVKKIKIAAMNM